VGAAASVNENPALRLRRQACTARRVERHQILFGTVGKAERCPVKAWALDVLTVGHGSKYRRFKGFKGEEGS
jgi:hypothetical protein